MYTIKIYYRTGNSFGSHDEEDELEGNWTLEIAKENLKRIKAHYQLYQLRKNYYSISLRDKAEKFLEDARKEPWFSAGSGRSEWEYSLNLLENDGTSKNYSTFWCGYFEQLNSAKIISKISEDDEMTFIP